jgi:hypothetical protein
MRYLALLGGDPSDEPEPGTPEWDAELAAYARFDETVGEAVVGGAALEPAATATTVRRDDASGEPLVTTGPFAETVEALGGFYVLEADSHDDAIDLARQLPAAESGWVAVRPMVMWETQPGEAPAGERYLALLYGKESEADQPGTAAWDEGAAEHGRFAEAAGTALLAGAALQPIDATTTVRVRDGELLLTDGPFSEIAEIVGGFYVLAAPDPRRAVELAATIPVNPGGAVEVRPIMEVD